MFGLDDVHVETEFCSVETHGDAEDLGQMRQMAQKDVKNKSHKTKERPLNFTLVKYYLKGQKKKSFYQIRKAYHPSGDHLLPYSCYSGNIVVASCYTMANISQPFFRILF